MTLELTYKIAKCCLPQENDPITGYFKEDGTIAVHHTTCNGVQGLRPERLLAVAWDEIQATERSADSVTIAPEFDELDETDYFILKHHQEFGMDYSIVVAEALRIPLAEMHQRHRKLRGLGGLKRVEGRIIHYRKNIVKGKWIKHRNHTYYELTPEGKTWIQAFEKKQIASET
ncbi:MAG: DUF2250 domain-containing protein [Candidatus Poribacteria bacterium]|nr:DUF2250 domain-containing protein [Candidatus Poribacteria bacterium]